MKYIQNFGQTSLSKDVWILKTHTRKNWLD